jgi:peptidyl-prolyl cis-trans isomerase B (cyclophilin B)
MTAPLLVATAALAAAELSPKVPFARPDASIPAVLSMVDGGVDQSCSLVLLDRDAKELARATATAGEVDLAALFPSIRSVERAVRVQVVVDGTPQGAPLIVVPLVSRPTIRTTQDTRPDGKTKFTRIIGWGSALLDPTNETHAALAKEWPNADPTPLSGFRIERDRDVIFETSVGRIRFAMCPDEAPNTARNFIDLAASGFYDGTIVHRIVPADRNGAPFVIQGGDPTGSGDGGPGYDIPLEPSRLPHDFGVISMARNDWPDSAGSQWFVALSREGTARLDGQYCAFGYAVEGADAITRIAQGEIQDPATGRPAQPEIVTRAFAIDAPAWTPGKGRPDTRVTRPASEPASVEADR